MEQDEQTDWFNSAAVSSDKDFDGISISKDSADIVVASFRSGKIFIRSMFGPTLTPTIGMKNILGQCFCYVQACS